MIFQGKDVHVSDLCIISTLEIGTSMKNLQLKPHKSNIECVKSKSTLIENDS